MDELARRTPGYVGADLTALAKEAAAIAVNRIFQTFHGGATNAAGEKARGKGAGLEMTREEKGILRDQGVGGSDSEGKRGLQAGDVDAAADHGVQRTEAGLQDVDGLGGTEGNAEREGKNSPLGRASDVGAGLRREPLTAEELEPLALMMQDFLEAVDRVQPSAKREGFATVDVCARVKHALLHHDCTLFVSCRACPCAYTCMCII